MNNQQKHAYKQGFLDGVRMSDQEFIERLEAGEKPTVVTKRPEALPSSSNGVRIIHWLPPFMAETSDDKPAKARKGE